MGEGDCGREQRVAIEYDGRRWLEPPGAVLTLGRGGDCDVQLPDDRYVSRLAASLHVMDDCVIVRNESSSKPLTLRPAAGEDRVVEPRAGTTSLPYTLFRLVFAGYAGVPIEVLVDASGLAHRAGRGGGGDGETLRAPVDLTPARRRVLAALCEPLLTRHGFAAAPATYAEIGAKLGLSPHYVRNVLKSLREELTGHGEPGLTAEVPTSQEDFRWPLARWAVRSGLITVVDVASLERLEDTRTGHE